MACDARNLRREELSRDRDRRPGSRHCPWRSLSAALYDCGKLQPASWWFHAWHLTFWFCSRRHQDLWTGIGLDTDSIVRDEIGPLYMVNEVDVLDDLDPGLRALEQGNAGGG